MKVGVVFKEENSKAVELAVKIKSYLGKKSCLSDKVNESDSIIALGGDGTIIHAACKYANLEIPIVGINTGKLGFLAACEAGYWQKAVDKLIDGDLFLSERMILDVSFNGKKFFAVNEVVIKGLIRVIELEVVISGELFLRVYGDGVIIATQTGSTAYSLSSRGPIVDPALQSLIVTPINPIGLPVPSAVLSKDKEVRVKVIAGEDVSLIIDGQHNEGMDKGNEVVIKKSNKKVKLGYFFENHFIRSLNSKLGISSRSF